MPSLARCQALGNALLWIRDCLESIRMNTESSPLFRACQVAGGLTSLAKLLDVKPPTIYQWLNASRPLPAERCVQIEEVTGGAVRCEELRPDVNWAVLRKAA